MLRLNIVEDKNRKRKFFLRLKYYLKNLYSLYVYEFGII